MSRRHSLLLIALILGSSGHAFAQVRERQMKEGDRILVKLWMDTLFSDTARIQDRSIVILPRLGPVSLEGLSASRVADSVRSAYTRVVRDVAIEATPLRRVTILGESRRPGVYYFETSTTYRDAVAMSGGVTDIGKINLIAVVRDGQRSDVKNWARLSGDSATIQSGDILIVAREPWLKRNIFTAITGTSVLLSMILTIARL